ncbi:MAG: CheR family methyltransferase [Spirochaetaceae bacterium]
MARERRFDSIAGTIAQAQFDAEQAEEREQAEQIDFKMVTFSLGGKDYAVDIMKVKEIAKFGNFTFVPNTLHYVRGVYNLRGDIISVIDLRRMFGVPVQEEKDRESGLILRVEDRLLGVIVDFIDRVVGISSSRVQPPHPIFADINISYIQGVVEHEGRLFILLDVDRIFGRQEGPGEAGERQGIGLQASAAAAAAGTPAGGRQAPPAETAPVETAQSAASQKPAAPAAEDISFIAQSLGAFDVFHRSPVNENWLRRRFEEWKEQRGAAQAEVQVRTEEEAAEFVRPFFSPYTGDFWGEDYLERVGQTLPMADHLPRTLNVWNPGCGKGFETYSLAVLLRRAYPDKLIKIWASDMDLLSISSAPNLVFPANSVPEYYREYLVEGTNGFSFNEEISDMILFEYHDVLHENAVPEAGLILSRDVLSLLPEEAQERVVADFAEKILPGGVVIPGENEELDALPGWRNVGGSVNAYTAVKTAGRSSS